MEGGNVLNYRIEKKNAFKVIVKKERFDSDNEVNKKQIPEFWDRCRRDGTLSEICGYINKNGMFGDAVVGMCLEENTNDKNIYYAIGAAYEGGKIADGLTDENIPAHTWAIFKCAGAMPDAIQELWHKIYSDFFPTSEYQPCGEIDFEVYPDGNINLPDYKSEIWIPVEKK
jgi:AraC family transcriptional regulator